MSKAWRKGSTRRWRKVRAAVLSEENNPGGMCTLRLEGCTGKATQGHHTRGYKMDGDNAAYVVPACAHCNQKVGDPTRGDPESKRWAGWS